MVTSECPELMSTPFGYRLEVILILTEKLPMNTLSIGSNLQYCDLGILGFDDATS